MAIGNVDVHHSATIEAQAVKRSKANGTGNELTAAKRSEPLSHHRSKAGWQVDSQRFPDLEA